MALIVLDANVLIAHLDPDDEHHAAATASLREHGGDDLRLPASAYAEALVVPAREGRIEEARRRVRALLVRIEPVAEEVAEQAAALRATSRALRLPDALVLGSAEAVQADRVLTTDGAWRRFARVRVVG